MMKDDHSKDVPINGLRKGNRVKKAKKQEKQPKKPREGSEMEYVGFVEGNQFWKLRSKHGRNKLFSDAQELWEAACEYFQWCTDNPLYEVDFRGKDSEMVRIPKMRVFTYEGLTRYLNCNVLYFNQFEEGLKDKTDSQSADFSVVITRIREIIREQKFTGAACGFLHPMIISRDLGLKEQTELTNPDGSLKTQIKVNFDSIFPDDVNDNN